MGLFGILQPMSTQITQQSVRAALETVMDPELHVDIVSLGLVYDILIKPKQVPEGEVQHVHILLTLTTPGCPLAHVFEDMIKEGIAASIPEVNTSRDVSVELTFDPPWIPDMMTEEARAELGFD